MATASGAGGGGGGFGEGDWSFWPNKSMAMSQLARLAPVPQTEQGGGAGGGGEGDGDGWPKMPFSMSERARMALALVPMPETTLKCPRCDSTNTKFCYFNNYSLTQPRHFCHACRRYWTRGGALRRAKRSTKPKAARSRASDATTCGSDTAAMPTGMQQYSTPCSGAPAGLFSSFMLSSESSEE